MAETTKIEWTDRTASPWHGCAKVAAGCDHCYAEAMSVRNPGTLGIWGQHGTRIKSKSFCSNLRKWNREGQAAGKPIKVFPSICDPLEDRPELAPWREEMFAVADECPWITLLLLTKRPENVRRMWPAVEVGSQEQADDRNERGELYRRNCWLGTSIATQADADRNIPELLKCRDLCDILFVSAEPLIEAVDFSRVAFQKADCPGCGGDGTYMGPFAESLVDCDHRFRDTLRLLDWLIIGGESGPHARPCNVAWIRSLAQQCQAAGVPCFVKQLGAKPVEDINTTEPWIVRDPKGGGDWNEWPADLRVRQFPNATN